MAEVCFLICPIGRTGTDIRRRSDQWVRHVVEPITSEFGYTVRRADDMPDPGVITNQVIRAIFESPLAIADLTGGNPNVYYELALRHACRKPFVQMISSGEQIPFDLQGLRTIEYDLSDPDHLKTASVTLRRHIQSIRDGHKADSPVSMAITESLFAKDDNALAIFLEKFWKMESDSELLLKGIDDLKETLDDVKSDVSSIESDVSSVESRMPGDQSSHTPQDIWRIQRSIDVIQADILSIKSDLKLFSR